MPITCAKCGRFIANKYISKGYHPEHGEVTNWQCPNCGLSDGAP